MSAEIYESVPNFSEGTDQGILRSLQAAAGRAHVLDLDADPDHNRAVLTLASGSDEALAASVFDAVARAVELIDLRRHRGVHPRVGAADVVPFVPLGDASMDRCVEIARELAERVWRELRVPVYLYGRAASSPERAPLAAVRSGRLAPDVGAEAHPTAGACCIGARPPLVAYNVLLPGASIPQAAALARALRHSSGGLPGVQALAFQLAGPGVQLSMNLVDLDLATPVSVKDELERLASQAGIEVGADEVVGLCPAVAAPAVAAGRLLEGRLAAAGIRAGAAGCRDLGTDEGAFLATRLEREADGLERLGVSPEEILQGAERSLAAARVLGAAGALAGDSAALLAVAATGFRKAVPEATRAREARRVAALDRWLEELGRSGLSPVPKRAGRAPAPPTS